MSERVVIDAYERAQVYFRGRMQAADAEDMAGAFILAFIPHVDRIDSPEHYTGRMLRNMLVRYWRERGRRPVLVEGMESLASHAAQDGLQAAISDEDVSLLAFAREALEREDSRTQQAVAIWMHEDLTQAEIASILGLTSTAVRMRICRYKKRVRESYAG